MSSMGGQTRRQSRRRTSGTVSGSRSATKSSVGSSPDDDLAQHGEIGVRQHGQGDVAMPAGPGTHLVLVEADLAFGGLEAGLDRPARAGQMCIRDSNQGDGSSFDIRALTISTSGTN